MHFELITVVPETVQGYLSASILGRAAAKGAVSFGVTPLRDFGVGRHRQVDDAPYGGGSGMVMAPGPLVEAIEQARAAAEEGAAVRVVMTSPGGTRFDREVAGRLADDVDHLVLVCGRYEGVDARVREWVDEEISLGDFVLTGGELAALSIVDAVARLLPDVLGNDDSSEDESFEGPLLEYPQYTRPRAFRGRTVPEVLLSGDHARIAAWRHRAALERTLELRPDRLEPRDGLPPELIDLLEKVDGQIPQE
jgi:tRNA (guanine37-N1)-methyltransferase